MIFITVSQSPNVKSLLEMMWDKIIRVPRPPFRSIEDAHNQLQKNLSSKAHRPTLVVLDDVWSTSNLEDLLFEAEGYKTIVTTRHNSTIRMTGSTRLYDMPIPEDADSLSLFCFWAFGQTSIPPTQEDKDIVKQVVAECGRLPLALTVIGRSLRGALPLVWKNAKAKLSRAEPLTDYHRERLINRLETSIDVLDNKHKQCFLDLGAFPEGRKFRVDSLLDIWVYVRQMEREDAFAVLVELEDRNLLDFTRDPGSQSISYNCSSELCFSQHDVMRDLALHLASKDSVIDRERLFIAHKNDSNPAQGLNTLKDKSSRAQFLSIHTGQVQCQEQDWGQIDFPEVEALALFFAANQYCLPTFLHSMPKLKVLIICNYNSKHAVLQALPDFSSLTQIKSLLLERLSVPSLYEHCRTWKSLEKASVCLCEGLGNMTPADNEQVLELPKFVEINLDHCIDLEKLPGEICNLTSLQELSVTNCHHIQKLPDDIGNLRSPTVLRLSTCIGLTMLPPSICKLQQLEFLDISQCGSLKDLPMEFHQLSNLKTLDMRECSRLKKLPTALGSLRSLERVICDENTEQQWLDFKASVMPNLRVDIVKEDFNLDWLLD